jgi:hypothetical protein
MNELLDLVVSPRLLLLSPLVFAVLPGPCLRLLVRLYPKSHPRRTELLGELYSMPQRRRPWFVVEQLELAIGEGLPARLADVIDRARELAAAPSAQPSAAWSSTWSMLMRAATALTVINGAGALSATAMSWRPVGYAAIAGLAVAGFIAVDRLMSSTKRSPAKDTQQDGEIAE